MQNTQASPSSKVQASVNQLAAPLVNQLLAQAATLQLGVSKHESGCTIVDAGIQHAGSAEAGRLIAEICMGGLGNVTLQADGRFALWGLVPEAQNRALRVVTLGDRETVHNAFFDRGFVP